MLVFIIKHNNTDPVFKEIKDFVGKQKGVHLTDQIRSMASLATKSKYGYENVKNINLVKLNYTNFD